MSRFVAVGLFPFLLVKLLVTFTHVTTSQFFIKNMCTINVMYSITFRNINFLLFYELTRQSLLQFCPSINDS